MKNMTTETNETLLSTKHDYVSEIISIIKSPSSPNSMREQLADYHENDIADVLNDLNITERKKLYRVLDAPTLSNILEYSDEKDAGTFLDEMDLHKAVNVIEHMESDSALDILREIDKEKRQLLIEATNENFRKNFAVISSFDDDQIGSRMTANYISITKDLDVKQAMHSLIEKAYKNDNISTLFVVDENKVFYGAIDLQQLIIARKDTDLDTIIMTSYPYVYGSEDIDDCIERIKDYSEDLIPVLDHDNHILGVLTSQSMIQMVDDEMGEDYAKLAGLTAEEDLNEPLGMSMRKRLPWLFILLILGMMVSSVVGVFESVVSQLTLIMCFQSLILDMAGNVGTQSLAVTIRVLMDETLTGRQKFTLVFKEMKIGFSNGLLLGIASFTALGLYIMLLKEKTAAVAFAISGCIGTSLLLAMVISSAVGTLVPLFFKKINVDPAVASGPLITTINDLVAVITYYGLSWILLLNVLHLS